MEAMGLSERFWAGKRVLLTGHTGFKGSWLTLWLKSLGAEVTGFALDLPTSPSLYELASVADEIEDHRGDLRDLDNLLSVISQTRPEIVLHLAAQPLVRESYCDPVGTYSTNVMGTVNLLESLRQVGGVRACVIVTTDKVYANREWIWPYREDEALGGHDPYSNSKACCELVVESFVSSFFPQGDYSKHGLALATARAGNVLGGGDYAEGRLIPDVLRAWTEGKPVTLRYPNAIRPWQYVLEPLAGYMQLAAALYTEGTKYAGAWNFGPADPGMCSVGDIIQVLSSLWPVPVEVQTEESDRHEAGLLRLDSSRARQLLGWSPRWTLQRCMQETLQWHLDWCAGKNMRAASLRQLEIYQSDAP